MNKKSLTIKNGGKELVITEDAGLVNLCFIGFKETEHIFVSSSRQSLNSLYKNLTDIPKYDSSDIEKIETIIPSLGEAEHL